MLCDNCKKNEACIHITQINGNKKIDHYLCEECAARYGDFIMQEESENQPEFFSINDFLSGIFHNTPPAAENEQETADNEEYACPACGMTYADFAQTGKIGCSVCYDTFRARLEPLLRRIHGSSKHTGKIPHRAGKTLNMQQELSLLRKQIQQYIANEEYEKAAQVRDCIHRLEKELKNKQGA
ncbi:UvrB/UvrC motif-containing protein [Pectinatus sottacetonis]|uniref:UvrB/UvrC motif-containing protein n=1 Tax=Pectinatus sottacetonis TaxID=1002795 RepID=UPI0018C6E08D|nr:UvrB/UvrC motif-containing protein [Pectinatus sottacetonis]